MEQYNQAIKHQQEMEGCTFQPQRKPPAVPRTLGKSKTTARIPGHDQFMKRQRDAYRLKMEKEEALRNIGRRKRPVQEGRISTIESEREPPLFDIELNIGDE